MNQMIPPPTWAPGEHAWPLTTVRAIFGPELDAFRESLRAEEGDS